MRLACHDATQLCGWRRRRRLSPRRERGSDRDSKSPLVIVSSMPLRQPENAGRFSAAAIGPAMAGSAPCAPVPF
jgi:hypothetical protein